MTTAAAIVCGNAAHSQIVQFSGAPIASTAPIVPADRLTIWQPGVTYNQIPSSITAASNTIPSDYTQSGYGIPNRTNIHATLTPSGGNDLSQIQTAVDAAGAAASAASPQVVLLSAGNWQVTGGTVNIRTSWTTLRGAGPGDGGTGGTFSAAAKGNSGTNGTGVVANTFSPNGTGTFLEGDGSSNNAIVALNKNGTDEFKFGSQSTWNLASDAIKDSFTCTLANYSGGISLGDCLLLDINTVDYALTYWSPRFNSPGANFVATSSGTNLTVSATGFSGTIRPGIFPNGDVLRADDAQTAGATTVPDGTVILSQTSGTTGGPGVYVTNNATTCSGTLCTCGDETREFFSRLNRSVTQMVRVVGISSSTLTFETPIHITMPVANRAQISKTNPAGNFIFGSSVENIYCFGGTGGDGGGSIIADLAAYCWIKNCEGHFADGSNMSMSGCYRCEIRDSYMHESPNPFPGGDSYACAMNFGTSDCLVENCIMDMDDKVIVMRGTGGGNVVAYNYMDDPYNGVFPMGPEAGVNAGHYTTPHMELIEGNWTNHYNGDSFWGNSIYITVLRNWCTGLRSGNYGLSSYFCWLSGVQYPYADSWNRNMCDIQNAQYNTNVVGNVFGYSGQGFISINNGTFNYAQNIWLYEELTALQPVTTVITYQIGSVQTPTGNSFDPTTIQTILRQGNWDWQTMSQRWHGIGGYVGGVNPSPPYPAIPNSYYLTGLPACFNHGGINWPWVDPNTGSTYTLPAKARFDNGTPNVIL